MLSPQTTEALNGLLTEERASVECEIAFASGATEHLEREAFTTMGREDVEMCGGLHELLASADLPVSVEVSPSWQGILALEHYDDRLRAFAEHQRTIAARASELLSEVVNGAAQEILQRLTQMHIWHVLWSEQRAEEFAATRTWENGRKPREQQGSTTGSAEGRAVDPATGATTLARTEPTESDGATREETPGADGAGPSSRREPGESQP